MGLQCVVPSCRVTYKGSHDSSPNKKRISYYMFPKDEKLKQIWAKKCSKQILSDNENFYVCAKHFKDEDFEPDLRSDLLDLPIKRKLKPHAIPSVKLTAQDAEEDNYEPPSKGSGRIKRYQQRERKKYIEEVLCKKGKSLKRSAEENSTMSQKESKPPLPKKKMIKQENPAENLEEIDAAELQKLLNIILERIQCLEQELEGLNHIMEDIKGRIENLQNRH